MWLDWKELGGVYKLIYEGEVVYVGRSRNIANRLRDHRKARRFRFTEVVVCLCDEIRAEKLERETIHLHQPRHNVSRPYVCTNVDIDRAAFEPIMNQLLGSRILGRRCA